MTIKPDLSQPIPAHLGKVHFIGIGGSGMSGIARMLIKSGHVVTGSDVRDSKNISDLRTLGAKITIGHDAKNLADCDTVVVTSALWPTNPEYVLAQEKGLPILHRSQALKYLTIGKRLISIAGAHGKTTSTGMIVTGLKNLGEDPSFVNGGVIAEYDSSSASGTSDLFVIEADESDGSFLYYDTAVALITNVDPDHLDHYGSLEKFEAEFANFANSSSEFVAISSDDVGSVRVRTLIHDKRFLTFGFAAGSDVRITDCHAEGPQVSFELEYLNQRYSAELLVPGRHNAVNAAGAFAVLVGLGFDPAKSLAAISLFAGTERRFELHGEVGQVKVFDDFAHHPTEVVAALTAARAVVGPGRLITVFQPHLYSRTRLFAKEFAEALALSDEVVVLDIYAAREDPEPGVTGALISEAFKEQDRMHYVPNWDEVPAAAAVLAKPGDFIITMGCGDVYRQVPEILKALEK
ncbi:MAG: UDP-N-acetylmuramate--L-alanine ligase [Micrococcales bacterium]|nr:UDP-N-acetylmuramate--L-alanine ligase [Micrococcales bacterium]NBR60342.1 UDP-N-acetylmuramate--L-alanine ligase [Actinomycetota bacterium]NBT46239.1 UDP-N-acetylmuramate--L-alanine ligase [Actinomycetota bacterium]NBY43511.1 UDP-N-acetylmuramate--L-alanine ligase [Micrococcales bacterium]